MLNTYFSDEQEGITPSIYTKAPNSLLQTVRESFKPRLSSLLNRSYPRLDLNCDHSISYATASSIFSFAKQQNRQSVKVYNSESTESTV